MAGGFRERVREWASLAMTEPVDIDLAWDFHGGKKQAYDAARKITVTFASLRQHERKRIDALQKERGEGRLAKTPFEDTYCTIIDNEGYYTVHFEVVDEEEFEKKYKVRGYDRTEAMREFGLLPELRSSAPKIETDSDGLANMPLGVDMFTGKPYEEK